uniref:uracil-DNA glycosylase n=1 Tax=Blattabacterium cuenoti TaxID=1653831 RepID=UPI00293BD420|nr:uracil-DNA glycosylase [Blattabacterium cuenoti]
MEKNDNWRFIIKSEFNQNYFKKLLIFLKNEYKNHICFPNKNNIFSSFHYCSFNKLKIVIIGQDPYYRDHQADGLSFSVPDGILFPPTLKNIFIEVSNCFPGKKSLPKSGSLIRWAKQGVLLLNSILTVREGIPRSHKDKGWEIFTDKIIQIISNKKKMLFFCCGVLLQRKKHF